MPEKKSDEKLYNKVGTDTDWYSARNLTNEQRLAFQKMSADSAREKRKSNDLAIETFQRMNVPVISLMFAALCLSFSFGLSLSLYIYIYIYIYIKTRNISFHMTLRCRSKSCLSWSRLGTNMSISTYSTCPGKDIIFICYGML